LPYEYHILNTRCCW